MHGNSISKVLEGLCRMLKEEKDKEFRGILKMRKKIQNLKKYLDEGSGGAYRQVWRELLERYKKYCTEREGMVLGLERAIDLVEQAEGKQGQQAPPPRSSPHPRVTEDQKSIGTPQDRQSTEERGFSRRQGRRNQRPERGTPRRAQYRQGGGKRAGC